MKKSEKHEQEKDPESRLEENASPAGESAASNGDSPAPEANAAPEVTEEPLVGLTLSEYSQLQNKADEAEKKSKEYFEGWQRERADFLNYRKRVERENVQLHQNLTGQIIKKYLVILDDLERAMKTRPKQGEGAAWAEGVELVVRKLNNILEAEGVKEISAEGAMFDPAFHEAISHEDSPDHESGQVIEVVQKGYMIQDRVLRHALVRVAR